MGWQILIGAVIAVIVWLILNFKDVVKWIKKLKEKFMEAGGPIGAFRDGVLGVVGAFKSVVSWVGNAITKVKEFLGMDTKKTIEVTTIQSGAYDSEKLASWGARHATGTPYFAGGMTRFSESGRSEAAIFPSGTQIIPHDQVPKMGGGKSIVINYIVQGKMCIRDSYTCAECAESHRNQHRLSGGDCMNIGELDSRIEIYRLNTQLNSYGEEELLPVCLLYTSRCV